MSYILEALKKAELQRGLGQVPGIGSEHEKPAHSVTAKWLWAGAAILVLNLALLTVLFWPDAGPEKGSRYSPELSQPGPATREPAQESAPTPVPSPQPVASPAVPVVAEPVPMPAADIESSVPAGFVAEPVANTLPVEEPAREINSLPVWPQIPNYLFQQLTGGIRLDVHVYSDLPQDRFVLINLQKYRTGERLQEGPLLDEITPEGVILSFQGQQFRVRAQ